MAAMAAILDFQSELFLLIFIYKALHGNTSYHVSSQMASQFSCFWSTSSPKYLLPSFLSISLSDQEKFKIDFQDGSHDGHIGFLT